MSKIALDKYYTPVDTAWYCINKTYEVIGKKNITEIIEPSAGDGSFSELIPYCTAYDIEPGHYNIIQQDFLALEKPYKAGRLFIGNPPFGTRNTLSVKFFKKAVSMGDYIAFILPISQYNNTQQMYEFDLVHSEVLPLLPYSGVELLCCFNIYKRPTQVHTQPISYKLRDLSVLEYRRGGTYPLPERYDFGMCAWGSGIGKEITHTGQYAQENYVVVHNEAVKEEVLSLLRATDWKKLYPYISSPKIQTWKIYKYLQEKLPHLV